MGATFRLSETQRIEYSKVVIAGEFTEFDDISLVIDFRNESLEDNAPSCWHSLFNNPVIARGFPVPERLNNELGLEMTIEMMAALSGARYAIDFDGGLVMKGLSVLLIPIKQKDDVIQWHLIKPFAGNRIKYEEAKRVSEPSFTRRGEP